MEKEIEDARGIRAMNYGEEREDHPSSSSRKRQKTSASHEFQDQGQDGAFSQARQTICYFCRQPRYVRRDCPQRQGSQDFRTAQSQLVVGQERIWFIPPHPSMDQRNRFQSQGAIQAPSATQIFQKGQSVGQGQGHGSQAETSSQAG